MAEDKGHCDYISSETALDFCAAKEACMSLTSLYKCCTHDPLIQNELFTHA